MVQWPNSGYNTILDEAFSGSGMTYGGEAPSGYGGYPDVVYYMQGRVPGIPVYSNELASWNYVSGGKPEYPVVSGAFGWYMAPAMVTAKANASLPMPVPQPNFGNADADATLYKKGVESIFELGPLAVQLRRYFDLFITVRTPPAEYFAAKSNYEYMFFSVFLEHNTTGVIKEILLGLYDDDQGNRVSKVVVRTETGGNSTYEQWNSPGPSSWSPDSENFTYFSIEDGDLVLYGATVGVLTTSIDARDFILRKVQVGLSEGTTLVGAVMSDGD